MARVPPPLPLGDMLSAHYVITPGRMEALDQYAFESIDADAGGLYTPRAPLIVGGAGLDLQSTCAFSGDVRVGGKGRGTKGITLTASASPGFGATRSRTINVPLRSLWDAASPLRSKSFEYTYDPYGIRSLQTGQASWSFPLPSLRLHNGATLLSARLTFRSGNVPEALADTEIPWIRIVRIKKEGVEANDYGPGPNVVELWKVPFRANSTFYNVDDIFTIPGGFGWGSNGLTYRCVTAGTTAAAQPGGYSITVGNSQVDGTATFRVEYGWSNGFLHYQFPRIPASASAPAYHNAGLPQEILHRVNQNATIDTETYAYSLELIDPGGRPVEDPPGSGLFVAKSYNNLYHSLILEIGGLTELREP